MGATEKKSIGKNGVSALGRAGALLILMICRVSAWAIGIRPALATAPALIVSGWHASRESTADPASRELCSRDTQGRSSRGSALLIAKAAKGEDTVPKSVKVGPLKQESIALPTGVSMEAIYQKPSTGSPKRSNLKQLPPLVFIHGSFHGAWCWAEHWMPFLAEKGYDTYSISLRGTSGTPIPDHDAGAKVKISEHVSDVRSFAETVLPGMRPVFISHSFGGMVLLKLMEELAAESRSSADGENGHGSLTSAMAGGVFLCSVPPSGNGPMTKRFIKERPLMVVKLIMGFVLKMAPFWPWLARDLFFSQALEQSTLKRYMYNFQADSKNGLDIIDLRAQLPSLNADAEGRATWIRHAPPRLVMGAERDRIVDEVGIQEMAAFLDTQHIMLPTVPHEVMLGPDWPLGADRLLQWLETTDFTPSS